MPGPLDDVVLGAYERAKERAQTEGKPLPTLGSFLDGQARGFESRGEGEKGRALRDWLAQRQAADLQTTAVEAAGAHEAAVLEGIRPLNPLAGRRGSRMTPGQAAELEQARAEKAEAAGQQVAVPVAPDAVLPHSNVDPSKMLDLLEAAGVSTKGMLEGDVRRRFFEQFGEQIQTDDAARAVAEHLWRQRATNVQAEEAQGAESRGEATTPQDFLSVGFGQHAQSADRARAYVRDVEAQRGARAADRAAASPFTTAMRENLLAPLMEGGAAVGSLFRKDPVTGAEAATWATGGGTEALQDDEARAVIAQAMDTPSLAIIRGAIRGAADLVPLTAATRGATAALAAARVPAEVAAPLGRALGMGVWSGLTHGGTPGDRAVAALQGALMAEVAGGVTNSRLLQRMFSALPGRASNAVTEAIGFLAGDAASRGEVPSTEEAIHSLVLGAFMGAGKAKTPAEVRLQAAREILRKAAEQAGVVRVGPDGRASIDPALIRSPDELAAEAATARAAERFARDTGVRAPPGFVREGVAPLGPRGPKGPLAGTTGDRTAVPPPRRILRLPQGELPPDTRPRWQQDPSARAAVEAEAERLAREPAAAPPAAPVAATPPAEASAAPPAAEAAPAPAAPPAPAPAPAKPPRRRILRAPQHEKAVERAREARTELRRMEDERYRDAKTGIRNADAWEAAKAREVGEGREVLRIDLGEFKALNDADGHEAGDRALGKVGARLREAAAEVGIPERNLFRTGGDEFTVSGTKEQVAALREALAKRGPVAEGSRQVHLDVGTGATPEAADAASREAKAARKKAAGIGTREEEAAKAAARAPESVKPPEPGKGEGKAVGVTPDRSPVGGGESPDATKAEAAASSPSKEAPRVAPAEAPPPARPVRRVEDYEVYRSKYGSLPWHVRPRAGGDDVDLHHPRTPEQEAALRRHLEETGAPLPDPVARNFRTKKEAMDALRRTLDAEQAQADQRARAATPKPAAPPKPVEPVAEPPPSPKKERPPLPEGQVEKEGRAPVEEPAKPGEDDGEGPQQKPQGPLPADTPSAAWKAYIERAIKSLGKGEERDVEVRFGKDPKKPERLETRPGIVYGDWAIVPSKVVPAVEPVEGDGATETRTEHPPRMIAEKGSRWQVIHVASGLKGYDNLSKAEALEFVLRLRQAKPDLSRLGKGGLPPPAAQEVMRHAYNEMRARMGHSGNASLVPIRGIPFTAKRRPIAVENGVVRIDQETLPEGPVVGFTPGTAKDPRGLAAQFAGVGWDGGFEVVDAPLKVSVKIDRYGQKETIEKASDRYLLWRDEALGVDVRVHPQAFGIDPAALAGAKRVEFDLDGLGIKRPAGSKMGRNLSPDVSFSGTLDALTRAGVADVVWRAPGEKPSASEQVVGDPAGEEPVVGSDRMDRLPDSLSDVAAPDPILEAPSPRNGFAMDLPPLTHGPTGEWKGKRVAAHRVVRALQRAIEGIPIRAGHMSARERRTAAGYFKVMPEVIRLREANDLPTAAHEAAHAVEKIVFWNQQKKPGAIPALHGPLGAQLERLGRMLYGSVRPSGGYKREGFAEFVRGWMFGKPDVATIAPEVVKWWEGFLRDNPRIAKRLNAARDLARQFMAQGRENAYAAAIERRRPSGGLARLGRLFKTRMVEAGDALAAMSAEAEVRTGRALRPSQDPYAVLTGLRLTHSARARYMVEHGMIDVAGNVRGPALREATAIVAEAGKAKGWSKQETIDRFTLYLWGRRAIERIMRRHANPGMSLEDAQALVREFQSPEFSLAAEKVYKWNRQVLGYAVSGGALSRREAATILGGSTDYIPLQRAIDRLDSKAVARAVQGGRPLRQFRGSGEAILDPFAVMAENAEKIVRWTHERMVANAVVALSKVEGMGRFVDKVPRGVEPKIVALDKIRKQLEDAGADLSGADADAILTFFTPKVETPRGKPIIAHRGRDGTVTWYEVDPALYEAIHGLDVARLPKWIDATFGRAARGLRLGTTGLRATFSLVTNPIRDAFTGYLQSATRDNPARYFGEQVRATANEALRMFGRKSPYSDLFRRLGGEQALAFGFDTRHTRRAVRELFSGKGWKGRAVRVLSTPIEHLRDLLQFPESATRIAELRRVAESVGYKPGATVTLDQMLQMLTAAKRVTVDFTAAGTWARSVNQVVPFFNASLQGARSFGRTLRERPLATVLKALATRTIPTLLLWNAHKDEDWYRDMPWRERFSYWWVPVGEHELVAVPRVYDWDNGFSVLPEAILDSLHREDPEAALQALGHFFSTTPAQYLPWSPVGGFRWGIAGENPLLGEALEQASNRDSFTGQKIVPEGERDLPVEEQVAPYTSGLARFAGRTLGWSPRRIDHALRGFTGGLAHDTADLADAIGKVFTGKDPGVGMRGPSRGEFKDVPIVGSALGRRGGREGIGSLAVERLYDALGAAREREASREQDETPEERLRRLTLEDAGRAVKWLRVLQGAATSQEERQSIQREIRSIAEKAMAQAGRRRFLGEAKAAEQRARAAATPAGSGRRILRPVR